MPSSFDVQVDTAHSLKTIAGVLLYREIKELRILKERHEMYRHKHVDNYDAYLEPIVGIYARLLASLCGDNTVLDFMGMSAGSGEPDPVSKNGCPSGGG